MALARRRSEIGVVIGFPTIITELVTELVTELITELNFVVCNMLKIKL